MKTFVEFYRDLRISPVSQDIGDLARHFRRRDALYMSVGIPPLMLRGRRVIEFGPGSGFNSIHTAALGPGRYVMVEGNPTGVERVRELFGEYGVEGAEVVSSLIEEFESEERFDLVICEGTLPFQPDPVSLLRTVASFAATGGVVLITCCDPVSYFAEALRRFLVRLVFPDLELRHEEVLPLLRDWLEPQLANLSAMTRPIDDWILDNLVQPFAGRRLFGIPDAVEAVGDACCVLGTSPRFLRDWRWYKTITGDPREEFNGPALEEYWGSVHRFLDHRELGSEGDPDRNRDLHLSCSTAYELCLALEDCDRGRTRLTGEMREVVRDVAGHARAYGMNGAADSIAAADRLLDGLEAGEGLPDDSGAFAAFFGRGQQYATFIRV